MRPPLNKKERLALEVQSAWDEFNDGLMDKRKYPLRQFQRFFNAVTVYAEATAQDKLIHRNVASQVNGLLSFLTLERKRIPGEVLFNADRLESILFSGYDPAFSGDEPPDSGGQTHDKYYQNEEQREAPMHYKYNQVYQFKITLLDIQPPIWRTIQVPASYSFWDFHVAIQDAMGWTDSHLHDFQVTNPSHDNKEHIGIPYDEPLDDDIDPFLPGWEVRIKDYFSNENSTGIYVYDFGDDWHHLIQLEEILPRVKGKRYPLCLAGKRKCPPEDVGGSPGYEEFLKAIGDPHNEENESYPEWVGGAFDPESFNPKKVRFDDPKKRWRIAFSGEME
jgi:hypothetical protein